MRNNEPSAPDTETPHSSCPYPVTPGQFPMPSTHENLASVSESRRGDTTRFNNDAVSIGMLSPYFRDQILPQENFPLIGLSDNGTETRNYQHHSSPSAPYINGNSASGEQIHGPSPIGFKIDDNDDEFESNPSAPPPSYNQLFAPKVANRSKTVDTGTCMDTRIEIVPKNGSTGSEAVTSTTTRTIIIPVVQAQRPTANEFTAADEDSCCATCMKLMVSITVIGLLCIIIRTSFHGTN